MVLKAKEIRIYFVPCEDIHKAFDTMHKDKNKFWKLRGKLSRGYAVITGDEYDSVYVCEKHFDLTLLAHECGHLRACGKKKHTLFPTTMNASGSFRWFCNPIKSTLQVIRHYKDRIN